MIETEAVQPASATAEPKQGGLGSGAAQAAPTAPHATPRAGRRALNGPERFWARWPVRVALSIAMVLSTLVHGSVVPLGIPHRIEWNDFQGEAAIPVDLLEPDDPAASSEPAPSVAPGETASSEGIAAPAIPLPARPDAAAPEAGTREAGRDAESDGSIGPSPLRSVPDAGPVLDGSGGAVSVAARDDAGAQPAGPRDPEAIIGAVGSVQAATIYVMLLVNAEVIRAHPVGAQLGYLLRALPQWDDFMSGTDLDPIRDTDWVLISGPSLRNTSLDVVLVHYSASDGAVDNAVRTVSRKYERGGQFETGVPGVKGSLVHADRAERVILRGPPHVLAVVPVAVAAKLARTLASARVHSPRVLPREAVYLRVVDPHHADPEIPETITVLRVHVISRSDAGADVLIDGDTKDTDSAVQAADDLRRLIRGYNGVFVAMATHGILDHVEVTTTQNAVNVRMSATRDQIEALVTLAGGFLGVAPPGSSAPSAEPAPRLPSRGPSTR